MTDSFTRASSVLSQTPLIDGHNDLPMAMRERHSYDFDACDIRQRQPELMTDIPRLHAGQVGGQFWSVFVPGTLQGDAAVSATLEQIDAVYAMVRRYPDVFELAVSAADVERVAASGKIASLLGMEGGHSIACSLGTLRMMHALGVRYLTLTHNDNVPWADAATDDPEHGGLTAFGEEVVAEMNRLGMLVDCSHVAAGTMADTLRVSEAPIVFSHSSCRAVCDHPRNIPDGILAKLPVNGGVAMVTFVPQFVSQEYADWHAQCTEEVRRRCEVPEDRTVWRETWKAVAGEYERAGAIPRVGIADIADHVDRARDIAGVDHLGVGGDYDGVWHQPEGLRDVSGYPALFAELASRGYSDGELAGIAGQNILRVLRRAEEVAGELGGGQR